LGQFIAAIYRGNLSRQFIAATYRTINQVPLPCGKAAPQSATQPSSGKPEKP
jgi:hypothetical protein